VFSPPRTLIQASFSGVFFMLITTRKVLVYDSSHLQCELLSIALRHLRYELEVKCVSDVESAIQLLTTDDNWVVVVSDTGSARSALAFAKGLHKIFPAVPMVFVLREEHRDRALSVLRTGVRALVYSHHSLSQLGACLDHVAAHDIWVRHVSGSGPRSGGAATPLSESPSGGPFKKILKAFHNWQSFANRTAAVSVGRP
jgi:DNA-binding NarL/FixJ family response regulator